MKAVFSFLGIRESIGRASQATPEITTRLNTRDSVARELLETERTYVLKVETLVEAFVLPLKSWVTEVLTNEDVEDKYPEFEVQMCRYCVRKAHCHAMRIAYSVCPRYGVRK
jgi:hypothetical protein